MAARLAPNLQRYASADAVRPALLRGWLELAEEHRLNRYMSLDDMYVATLLGAQRLGLRIRPDLRTGETFSLARIVTSALRGGSLDDPLELLLQARSERPPKSLLRLLTGAITDRYYGLQSLALATLRERGAITSHITSLPPIPEAGGVGRSEDLPSTHMDLAVVDSRHLVREYGRRLADWLTSRGSSRIQDREVRTYGAMARP